LAGCPGYQYRSVIYHAPYLLAPGNSLIISKLQVRKISVGALLSQLYWEQLESLLGLSGPGVLRRVNVLC
jgi:hypothetical protein